MIVILTVIIVSYNVKYYLRQCLHSVNRAGRNLKMEVIVVDNASTDGTKDDIESDFPGVQLIWNKSNRGFAKACNQGLQNAGGTYILFLNPDTIVKEDSFEKCIRFFESHPDTGVLGVKMIDEYGRFLKESKRGFPDPPTALMKLTGLSHLFPHSAVFARYYLGHLDENQTHEIDVIAGAFMMIRKETLLVTGGFDEAFFMYGEDIDLSYRIQKQGYKNYYYPEVIITHFKGKSTPQKNLRHTYVFYNAMHIFVQKHYGKKWGGCYKFIIMPAIWGRAGIALIFHWSGSMFNYFKRKK